jgi:hypothetical protein
MMAIVPRAQRDAAAFTNAPHVEVRTDNYSVPEAHIRWSVRQIINTDATSPKIYVTSGEEYREETIGRRLSAGTIKIEFVVRTVSGVRA